MKKIISLILVIALTLQVALAAGFTDLDQAKWAIPYIEKVAETKLMTAYTDGSFKPMQPISKYMGVVVLYRMLVSKDLVNLTEVATLKTTYQKQIETYGVPTWPDLREAVAYFLGKNVITENELKTFIVSGVHQNISREQLSRYLGKAINITMKEDINQVINVNLKDIGKIEFESLRYINILNKYGIISGDTKGYFNPANNLTRAELAKVISVSLDVLATKPIVETVIPATVYIRLEDAKKVVFYEKDNKEVSHVETITDAVEILVGDQKGTFADLLLDAEVDLVYRDGLLSRVKVAKKEIVLVPVVGRITDRILFNGARYVYLKINGSEEVKFFTVGQDVPIMQGETQMTFESMGIGDEVTLGVDGNKAYTLSFKSKIQNMAGTYGGIQLGDVPQLMITIEGTETPFALGEKYTVTRNGKAANLSDLYAGDTLDFETTYELITKITATGLTEAVKGVIQVVTLGDVVKVSLLDVNKKLTSYDVSTQAKVMIDGVEKSVFDLRANQSATVRLKDNKIIEISVNDQTAKTHLVGKVTLVNNTLKVLSLQAGEKTYTVNLSEKALLLDVLGTPMTFDKLAKDQTLFVYGTLSGVIFTAEKILRLE